ncbi:uncharacterized protein N7506_006570 [Penicillium brevicompactum]|uniref:uncharacterized protein n=1 Tax=Penicillium brevicompactum TaxID=5074 RepID=UPI00254219BB|nr:uncharacterized protein N7506_006570 [Penicillium brevicompactum]KAJ5332787.1 hypothetical protein N7506_006570 [Penicillium brevicompactum]
MSGPVRPKHRRDFDVAVICALQLEADAVEEIFDCFWDEDRDRYGKALGDQNAYRTGVIGDHNVVLAYMPDIGKGHAASVAASFRSSFQGIRLALIVGVCGGVPGRTENDIFLGDVIISDDIVPYDLGRRFPAGFRRKGFAIKSANAEIQAFLHKLRSRKGRENLLGRTNHHLDTLQKQNSDYRSPERDLDRLFKPSYHHQHHGPSKCRRCHKNELCVKAQEATCESLKCDPKRLVNRPYPSPSGTNIHFGRMASGDTVMKSSEDRDRIAAEENVIAFEMEGAGIIHNLPCIVVKGVCDYADSHKDKIWQKYTAATAAACMKSLLEQWAIIDQSKEESRQREDLIGNGSSCHLDTSLSAHSNKAPSPPIEHDIQDDDLLQVLPIIISRFKSTLSCFKHHKKFLPKDVDLRSTLRTQRVVLLEVMETLSSDASDALKNQIGSSENLCLKLGLAIRTKLVEVEETTMRLPVATKAREQHDAVEDLKSMVQVFASSIPHPKQPRASNESHIVKTPRGRRQFQQFRVVRQAACSLYDALGTACNVHAVHDVHISLQPDLDGKRVNFSLAIIQNDKLQANTIWINVESTVSPLNQFLNRPFQQPQMASLKNDQDKMKKRKIHQGLVSAFSSNFYKSLHNQRTDSTKSMGQYERVRLAKNLATAFLYYHSTPWLNETWRSEDVQFFGPCDSLLHQAHHVLPYMTTSIRAVGSSINAQRRSSDYTHIRNPVLFGLGVMLLELAYQAPLRTLQQPVDLEKGETQGFADWFTAHRLVDQSYRMVSKSYKTIIKKCLYCDFGHDSDFASPALQEAFYHDVITGLENLERIFRELQLDDPEIDVM